MLPGTNFEIYCKIISTCIHGGLLFVDFIDTPSQQILILNELSNLIFILFQYS